MVVKVWVLMKEFSDKSGYIVVRVYTDLNRANEDRLLVDGDEFLKWTLHEVPWINGEEVMEAM